MSRIRRTADSWPSLAAASLLALTAACSSGSGSDDSAADDGTPSGDITRPDQPHRPRRHARSRTTRRRSRRSTPTSRVTFEAITDYDGEVKTRMNTDDYGDVLILPTGVANADLSSFFEPLGTTDELGKKYRFVNEQANDGKVYALATFGNANGIVYNKKVFAGRRHHRRAHVDRGVHGRPAGRSRTRPTPCRSTPTTRTAGRSPGRRASWARTPATRTPWSRWPRTNAPWTEGQEKYEVDSLLYDVAAAGLIEARPDDDQLGGLQEPDRPRARSVRWCSAPGRSRR